MESLYAADLEGLAPLTNLEALDKCVDKEKLGTWESGRAAMPVVLGMLPRLRRLKLGGETQLQAEPRLARLTALHLNWAVLDKESAVAAAAALRRLRIDRAPIRWRAFGVSMELPTGQRVALALGALAALPHLEELCLPLACWRPPGGAAMEVALVGLRTAAPRVRIVDLPLETDVGPEMHAAVQSLQRQGSAGAEESGSDSDYDPE